MIRLLISCLIFISLSAQANMVVVVAKSSSLNKLDNQHIANIFLARTNRYPNGEKALPIELNNLTIRNSFYHTITGKSANQLSAYWTTLVFTGKGTPPKTVNDVNQLIRHIVRNPGSIAYIDSEMLTDELKVIYRFP